MTQDRRGFLRTTAVGAMLLSGSGRILDALAESDLGPDGLPDGTLADAQLASLPGKLPLIKKTWRPPNFETPLPYLEQPFTPANAFFVRYHFARIPEIEATKWVLSVAGDSAEKPYQLNLDSLRRDFESVELNALCLCSGNRRGLSDPHVPGIQWGHGAMGNARWKGVRLRDVLTRAGARKDTLEVVFDGADSGVLEQSPDFTKSLPIWKALDENTLLAYEMNGEPLPHWNGFPVRLVVPGWTATYWMKHLTSIHLSAQPFKGFWMSTAYRIPKGRFPVVDRFVSQETESATPITEMVVSSLITYPRPGARIDAQAPFTVRGVAWDGGYGIADVLVSVDGGAHWQPAQLGPDLGRFAWRQWRHVVPAPRPGASVIMARATNRQGASQTEQLLFNPAGYHNNVIQRIPVEIVG